MTNTYSVRERLKLFINRRDSLVSRRAGYIRGRRRVTPPGVAIRRMSPGEPDQFVSKLNEQIRIIESIIRETITGDQQLGRAYLEITELRGYGLIRAARIIAFRLPQVDTGKLSRKAA